MKNCGLSRTQPGKLVELSEYPGYFVSNLGEVYSPTRRLKPRKHSAGYLRVSIGGKDHYIHRLVYSAHVGIIPEGLQVRHLDGDKTNNCVSNLAVGTQSDNELDKRRYGADPRGSKHGAATITEEDVVAIRDLWDRGLSAQAIKESMRLGMSISSVHAVATSLSWKHIAPATRMKRVKGSSTGFKRKEA